MLNTDSYFSLRDGVRVLENDEDVLLRNGVLHLNEITIDKTKSDKNFLAALHSLVTGETVALAEDSESYADFQQLVDMGFVVEKDAKPKCSPIFVVPRSLCDKTDFPQKQTVILEEILPADLVHEILLGRKEFTLEHIDLEVPANSRVVIVSSFLHLNRLRALNRILRNSRLSYLAAVVDTSNVYVFGVQPSSGCFECLETKIMSRFPGMSEDYLNGDILDVAAAIETELQLAIALLSVEISGLKRYRGASVDGLVMHANARTLDFVKSVLLRTALCSACGKINNARFEERNIRAMNFLSKVENDLDS